MPSLCPSCQRPLGRRPPRRCDCPQRHRAPPPEPAAIVRAAVLGLGPTPADPTALSDYLRSLLAAAQISQSEAARAVRYEARAVRRWLAPPDAPSRREPPWVAVEALRAWLAIEPPRLSRVPTPSGD